MLVLVLSHSSLCIIDVFLIRIPHGSRRVLPSPCTIHDLKRECTVNHPINTFRTIAVSSKCSIKATIIVSLFPRSISRQGCNQSRRGPDCRAELLIDFAEPVLIFTPCNLEHYASILGPTLNRHYTLDQSSRLSCT